MKAIKLLSLLLVMSILTSCGIIVVNDGKGGAVTTPSKEEITYVPNEYDTKPIPSYEGEAKALVDALPDMDFGGHTVVIATDAGTSAIWDDVEGPYVSAVLKRNAMVADKYNTVVSSNKTTASALAQNIKSSALSGNFYADFASVKSGDIGSYYSNGSIRNYKVLTYSDFSAPYFDSAAIDQLTLNDVIYGVVGAMTDTPESYGCLFFNKTMGNEIGISIDYSAVYDHNFTWDMLFTSMASADTENAVLSSSYDNQTMSSVALLSAGQRYLSRNSSGNLASDFNTDVSKTVISNLKKLLPYVTGKTTLTSTVTADDGSEKTVKETVEGLDIFIKGRALYAIGKVSDMTRIANCGFEWEILPIPNLTEGSEYIAAATDSAPVLVLLKASKNIEQNGYILQALGAASYKHMQIEFAKYAMQNYASSYYTFDMLELIIGSPIYDHAIMFGSNYSQLRNGTYVTFHNAVTGKNSLSSYINKTKNDLQKYLNARN